MDRNRMKRVIAVMLTIAMLLCENGEQAWIMAASVDTKSNTESVFENTESDSAAVSDESETEKISSDSNSDDANNSDETNKDINGLEVQEEESTNPSDTSSDAAELQNSQKLSRAVTLLDTDGELQNGVALPDDLSTMVKDTLYEISDFEGWIALANYSKENDLYGFKFCYNPIDGNKTLDFTAQTEFKGLGSETNPFAGELSSNYAVDNLTLKLNQPLFSYLSSKAKIYNNKIEVISPSCAGLAKYLVAEGDNPTASYKDISISGTVGNNTMKDCTGGLFAYVRNSTGQTLNIQGASVSVSTFIQSQTAGGLIGELNGSAELVLDGIDFSQSYISGISGNNAGKEGCIGGLFGYVNGTDGSKLTLTASDTIVYTRPQNACEGNSLYCGGFFGCINNMDIDVKCPITYVGNNANSKIDILGYDAGTFAGCIEQAIITLYSPVVFQDIRIDRPSYQTGFAWEVHGIGIFAGVMKNAEISVGDGFNVSSDCTDAVTVKNTSDAYYNCQNNSNSNTMNYNIGGFVGYVSNSDLSFTEENPCTIQNIFIHYGKGNLGGIIGRCDVSDKEHTFQNVHLGGNYEENIIKLSAFSGNTGGMAGEVHLSANGTVNIENCNLIATLEYCKENSSNSNIISVGIGNVTSDKESIGKIILENIETKYKAQRDEKSIDSFGGLIGKCDSDFSIKNASLVCMDDEHKWGETNYYGGLVGQILNSNSDTVRKGIVSGSESNPVTLSGRYRHGKVLKAYGGLFGSVEKNTAISLSGFINESGQEAFLTDFQYPASFGSIVGEMDDALIYKEPDTQFTSSNKYECDEIGNYGSVIQNGCWDGTENGGQLLIQDFQVMGKLTNNINTTGDLLRFAIAMSTQGEFLPTENQTDGAELNSFDSIRKAHYTLSQSIFDLNKTGVTCLARNDEQGISYPFQGSFIGTTTEMEKTTIKFSDTNHNHPYSGLFPCVDGGIFQSLALDYQIIYQDQKYTRGNNGSSKNYAELNCMPEKEYAGGIASVAKGNITVQNVSYTGTIQDNINSNWNKDKKKFQRRYYNGGYKYRDKEDDFLGGIFGKYEGTKDSGLTIENLSSDIHFTYQDYTHVIGGVIGYVDLSNVGDGTCSITVGGTTENSINLGGTIQVKNLYNDTQGDTFPIQASGMIAKIGDTRSEIYTPKCQLTLQNMSVDGLKITEECSVSSDSEIGGFLGWKWIDVDTCLDNIKIGTTTETNEAGLVKLSTYAPFGGLVHTVAGKMLLENLTIGANIGFDAQSASDVDKCGLLVRNGQYLYLDVRNYNVADEIKLLNYVGSDFDELVGYTKGGDDGDTIYGGVISIGSDTETEYYLGRGEGNTYTSYISDHVVDDSGSVKSKDKYTRYYYDLNKLPWNISSESVDISILDSADDMMQWHLLHYANSYLRKALYDGYTDSILKSDYTISGTINLSGYSIYPTPAQNENYHANTGTSIQFDAQSLIDGENKLEESNINNPKKYPGDSSLEHFQMHAGLFSSVSGLTVTGLTIGGTYSVQDQTAGALVSGSVAGVENGTDANGKTIYNDTVKNSFSDINLNNLWCVSHDTMDYNAPIGLMISDISSGAKVQFDKIIMSGYSDSDVTDSNKAASALIGNVGGKDATYISMNFQNMDIMDSAQDKSSEALNSSKMDEALAKASFIYSYEYSDNCNGVYTFTYADYYNGRCNQSGDAYVTLGKELGTDTEYFDIDQIIGWTQTGHTGISFNCENYLPYVFKTKQIQVNPKAGNLDQGCGTYEDPYIISSTRQLMSLYRYLYEENSFKTVLASSQWKVNAVGDDSKFCDGSHTTVIYEENDNTNFPSKEKLSQAYYQITEDIDLKDYSEFNGFGSEEYPFVGIFIGKKIAETNQYPTIHMPEMPDTKTMPNYGWIQYAKGCVVKDLVISYSKSAFINQQVTVTDSNGNPISMDNGGAAGGVIATVLGGDNVIDQVSVTGKAFIPGNTNAMIGGYIGVVNAGGVILRNISNESLNGFSVQTYTTALDQYPYICGMIGRVYDGYVVYDGEENTKSTALFNNLNLYKNDGGMNSSLSYDIINSAYLEDTGDSKISWSTSDGFGNIVNDKLLQALSMALNAGLLNYDVNTITSDEATTTYLFDGYNQTSRQRSGNYDYVGQVEEGTDSVSAKARETVIKEDNQNGAAGAILHSYLSQFFKWSEMLDEKGNSRSLNPYDGTTTYTLTGTSFDMSVYKTAFRGLGARYLKEQYVADQKIRANVFHGNFTGPDSSAEIKLDMLVDGVQDVENVALFNEIINPSNSLQNITIKNITLTGSVINKSEMDDNFSVSEVGTKNAAAVAATLQNVDVTFDHVTLNSMEVKAQKYAGGMAAYCLGDSQTSEIIFQNCNIDGTEDNYTKIYGCADTGGFIAYSKIPVYVNQTAGSKSTLKFLDVETKSDAGETKIEENSVLLLSKNTGGIIGTTEKNFIIQNITGNYIRVITTGDKRNVQIGGLVGRAEGNYNDSNNVYKFDTIELHNLTVENSFSGTYTSSSNNEQYYIIGTGGVIGAANGTLTMSGITLGSNTNQDETIIIQNINDQVPNHNSYGNAGFVGRHIKGGTLEVTNCKLLGVKMEDGSFSTKISGRGSNVAGITGNCYDFTGTDVEINGVSIDGARCAGGIISWAEEGKKCNLTNVSVKNVDIALKGTIINGSPSRDGYVGGLLAYGKNIEVSLSGAQIYSLAINSDYCTNVGGYFGEMYAATLAITSTTNTISNCFLRGQYVGGVVGLEECNSSKSWYCKDGEDCAITISGNKFIACREDLIASNKSLSGASAGGYGGYLVIRNQYTSTIMENVTIQDNLISAYDNNCLAALGGISGSTRTELYFYDVTLKDNYIGMMKLDELPEDRSTFLTETPIVGSSNSKGLRDYLHYVTDTDLDGTCQIDEVIGSELSEEFFYQYAYLQGTAFGEIRSDASIPFSDCEGETKQGIPKLINTHISYTDFKYRPVSDVGAAKDAKLTSNSEMYANSRKRCAIVYDGWSTEKETDDIKTAYSSMGMTYDNTAPYTFGNLEDIMDAYQSESIDRRQAYLLDDNYQNGEAIDKNTSVTNYDKLEPATVYENTYKKGDKYYSPFQTTQGKTLPMVVYNSMESGTLDQVIQTYVNILTNNSGALNSYVNDNRFKGSASDIKCQYIVSVKTYAAKFIDGSITIDTSKTASPSVSVTSTKEIEKYGKIQYEFSSEKGDDWDTATNEGTFTFVEIIYGRKTNASDTRKKQWKLIIPVYVEKRLQVYSNMKMLEGIEYNANTIKNNGSNTIKEADSQVMTTLSRGSSYSIYAEYIYGDSEKFTSVKIPKTLYIPDDGDLYFLPGTKMTLIALDEGGKAYYHTISDKTKEINFSDFKGADGTTAYETKDILTNSSAYAKTDYTDCCNQKYSGNSLVERFVILVDTSEAEEAGNDNRIYSIYLEPLQLEAQDKSMYDRTDFHEHCYEYINEIPGITYQINTRKDEGSENSNTYLEAASSIKQDGKVSAHLKYDISASNTYWKSVKDAESAYMDVGFSLAIKEKNSDGVVQKIPIPDGTTIVLGSGDSKKSLPAVKGQTTTYYYQNLRNVNSSQDAICVSGKEGLGNISNQIVFSFDFSNADLSSLEAYSSMDFYVVAQLVVTNDMDLPSAGDIKDTWEAKVGAEMKSDFGFALDVDDLTTLGMNQYSPEESDSGVVSYTANIAFPENNISSLESKYYTILYQVEKKTSQKDSTTGKPSYQSYTGDDVSLYLGKFDTTEAALNASKEGNNSLNSGNGLVAVTYQFGTDQIASGADLTDGKTASGSDKIAKVIKTHCTLVANCSGLDMTNYRVKAYLLVTDSVPTLTTSGNASSTESESTAGTTLSGTDSSDGCLKYYWLRDGNWPTISSDILTSDLKSDYFVFTVAKIKTSM